MMAVNIGLRLRDRLGPEASQELSDTYEEAQNDMLTISTERFDARLAVVGSDLRSELYRTQSELRQDMARMEAGIRIALSDGLSKIRTDMTEIRVDVVRWSFIFWVGQFAAMAALIGFMLRTITR